MENELYHYGVPGMKWGVRRYRNEDGSLTTAGKKRMAKDISKNWSSDRSKITEKYGKDIAPTVKKVRDNEYAYLSRKSNDDRSNVNKKNEEIVSSDVKKLLDKYGNTKVKSLQYPADVDYLVSNLIKSMGREQARVDWRNSTGNKERVDKLYSSFTKDERKQVDMIQAGFKGKNPYGGWYNSELKANIGNNKVKVNVLSRKGSERSDSIDAVEFLKKYNLNKAKEGIVKEYYDKPDSWIDKSPGEGSNYYTRDEFKNKIKPYNIDIDPDSRSYTVSWNDGDTYGGHDFVDEGSLDDMKVKYRSLQG